MNAASPTRILVLCSGNTCRSPMAAALLARDLATLGIEARIFSAGIGGPAGSPASPAAVAVMREVGIDLSGHTSRVVTGTDIGRADLIVVMTDSHRIGVEHLAPDIGDRVRVLGVADPYGSDLDHYREARDRLAAESAAIASGLGRDGPPSRLD